jgi:hypothetical protein
MSEIYCENAQRSAVSYETSIPSRFRTAKTLNRLSAQMKSGPQDCSETKCSYGYEVTVRFLRHPLGFIE